MRNGLSIMLLLLVFHGSPVFAIEFDELAEDVLDDGFYPGFLCPDCRDPMQYPADYAAVIYNGYFGEDPWLLESTLGVPFRIYNLNTDYVVIWFEGVFFDAPSLLPDLMDIRIRLENGVVITLTVMQDGPDMWIGERDENDGGGSDGDDDDYEERDEEVEVEIDESDGTGYVEIIDPDENGEFPEWEEEA